MSMTELKIPFPTEKLEALRFFIGKKEQTIEQELKEYLDKTYERAVPAHVREYVESRIVPDPTQEQVPDVAAPRERQPRLSRRQRGQEPDEVLQVQEIQPEQADSEPEENQGITMGM